MRESESLMIDDLMVAIDGTGNTVARARWQQGYKTGKRTEREKIIALIEKDAFDWAAVSHRTADMHQRIIRVIQAGRTS